ncbi:MAG: Rrf2 family transcriptional regulator [Cryomorphaceae bacterium]|nr:Rrf2 family transcriptional regulator [Flavobacteriales bacterium]
MFSRSCEYGIRATLYIASKSRNGERVNLKDIAKEIESPPAFTAKILQILARNGVIESLKGPTGGFIIRDSPEPVRLIEVVSAIDGNQIFEGCGLGLKQCDANFPCPVHDEFSKVRNALKKMLEETVITDISEGLAKGMSFLKR